MSVYDPTTPISNVNQPVSVQDKGGDRTTKLFTLVNKYNEVQKQDSNFKNIPESDTKVETAKRIRDMLSNLQSHYEKFMQDLSVVATAIQLVPNPPWGYFNSDNCNCRTYLSDKGILLMDSSQTDTSTIPVVSSNTLVYKAQRPVTVVKNRCMGSQLSPGVKSSDTTNIISATVPVSIKRISHVEREDEKIRIARHPSDIDLTVSDSAYFSVIVDRSPLWKYRGDIASPAYRKRLMDCSVRNIATGIYWTIESTKSQTPYDDDWFKSRETERKITYSAPAITRLRDPNAIGAFIDDIYTSVSTLTGIVVPIRVVVFYYDKPDDIATTRAPFFSDYGCTAENEIPRAYCIFAVQPDSNQNDIVRWLIPINEWCRMMGTEPEPFVKPVTDAATMKSLYDKRYKRIPTTRTTAPQPASGLRANAPQYNPKNNNNVGDSAHRYSNQPTHQTRKYKHDESMLTQDFLSKLPVDSRMNQGNKDIDTASFYCNQL